MDGKVIETEYLIQELEEEVEGLKGTRLTSELDRGEGCFRKEGGSFPKLKQVLASHNLIFPEVPTGIKAPGLFR